MARCRPRRLAPGLLAVTLLSCPAAGASAHGSALRRPALRCSRGASSRALHFLRGGADVAVAEEEEDDDEFAGDDAPSSPPQPPQQAHERITSFGGLLRMYREAPPITRTWITGSVFLSVLVAARRVDLRAIGFSERDVLEHGEWWRLLVNFFYMGDQVLSIFYWLQLYHFAECLKVLELVKYRWEPADFVKTILVNAAFLLVLKQFSKSMIFLGSPMVMVFVYLYARTCARAAAAPHAPQFGPHFGPHFGASL